jgi:hypothetical protein
VELERIQERAETAEPLSPDDAVDPGKPLYRQLMSAFAEESAGEDAIYFLGRALGDGAVGCEAYLKQVQGAPGACAGVILFLGARHLAETVPAAGDDDSVQEPSRTRWLEGDRNRSLPRAAVPAIMFIAITTV